jgi:hypothetical protein
VGQIEDPPHHHREVCSPRAAAIQIEAKEDQLRKDTSPKKQRSAAQIEHDAEIAARARLTASLREQRLKRDAELLASGVLPEAPPKRAARKKPA